MKKTLQQFKIQQSHISGKSHIENSKVNLLKFFVFRCNPAMAPFEFCEPKDIDENLRFKVLELRDRNEPEFVGMVVPNRLKEIPTDILTDYNRRRKEEGKNLIEDEFDYDEDEIDSKRIHGRKYLKQVYTKVFQQCRNAENNLIYEDVVNEKLLPHIEYV